MSPSDVRYPPSFIYSISSVMVPLYYMSRIISTFDILGRCKGQTYHEKIMTQMDLTNTLVLLIRADT
jgi:hypothetical protein